MAKRTTDHISTVDELDLSRFAGTWFEIGRLPLPFAKDWVATTDTYIPVGGDRFSVLYEGRKGTVDGPNRRLTQRLRAGDTHRPGEMRASFVPFLWLPYRIVYLEKQYRRMIVTSRSMSLLWLMDREPTPSEEEYTTLVGIARNMGFDTDRLVRVPQRPPVG